MANFICIAGRHINLDQVRCITVGPNAQQGMHNVWLNWAGLVDGSPFDVSSRELAALMQAVAALRPDSTPEARHDD